ncbi:hypothetical protein LTS12_022637 [Elasticomyces elasticus]|nr:hypothetical protein LTS12_022637 [Elasticomyces elasticus]
MAANALIMVGRILLAAAPYAAKALSTKEKPTPPVSEQISNDKSRWLQGTLRNATDFPIVAIKSYFDSGRYDQSPARVDSFDTEAFTCCEGDNTFMTGVSGGQTYQIDLDEDNSFAFSIGFTNPYAGTYKAGVAASSNPEDGYNAASQAGGCVESPTYLAKDEEGHEVKVKFSISVTAGQRPQYVVSEIRHY